MTPSIYLDPSQPVDSRVEDLLGKMTLEEKIGQLSQLDGRTPIVDAVRAGLVGSILCVLDDDAAKLQRVALEARLRIPLLVGIDAIHGHSYEHGATILPSQLALSCAWSEELAKESARVCAVEMAHTGCHWTFSPVCCLPRDLRWGRVDETFGEDPLLIGRLAAAMVRGYQGDALSSPDSVAACVKHFVGYGDTMGGLDASEADHSRRKIRSWFLDSFHEAMVKADAASVMVAYQAIDGVPCVVNHWLLTEILRDEWGWKGIVLSDWDNVGRLVRGHRVSPDFGDAARRSVMAGMDMAMSTPSFHAAALAEAEAGRIPVGAIDAAVRRILTLKFKLGLFENPRIHDSVRKRAVVGCEAHRAVALKAVRESATLLVNRGVLPLDLSRLKRVAVIGPHADDAFNQLGDWSLGASNQTQGSMHRHPRSSVTTIRDGLERRLGPDVIVDFAEGCGVSEPRIHLIPKAVEAVKAADAAILVLGDHDTFAGEFKCTATMELMGGQKALFDAVRATGTPLVVVFMASKPLCLPEIEAKADALLCVFNPGVEGGTAIAEILCGDINPSGKLTVSFPRHVGQMPVQYRRIVHQHGSYADLPQGVEPLFPFGFGLSYTSWRYSGLRLAAAEIVCNESVAAEFNLRNTGVREGVEIVQCYLHVKQASVTWPNRVLVDWRRVSVRPGEEAVVRFEIPYDKLSVVDADGRVVVEPGEFELQVGSSSKDKDLMKASFKVKG